MQLTIKDYIPIFLTLIKDWRVIITIVAMITIISFANFVVRYKKHPQKTKSKKSVAAPKPETSAKTAENQDKTEEEE